MPDRQKRCVRKEESESMVRQRRRILAGLAAGCFMLGAATIAYGASKGTWVLSDNGKRWMYCYEPGEPVKDEWITYEGKEYYLDSSGYMKTGWVTDKEDGSRYYMGEDGAKCYNTFTKDDKYVGPDGTALTEFDTYRKAVKKQLLSSGKKSGRKKTAQVQEQKGFVFFDFNGDGYKDIAVFNRVTDPDQVLLAAVWNPEDQKLEITVESDEDSGQTSRILWNQESRTAWLVMEEKGGGSQDYFVMRTGDSCFEPMWQFVTETNDWGDLVGYVNGEEADSEDWQNILSQAEREAGAGAIQGILPLEEEHIKQAVDQAPSTKELYLWGL